MIDQLIMEILVMNEMRLPTRKLGGEDTVLHRKLKRQENVENIFAMDFFRVIEKFVPKNERTVDKFIDRFHKYISKDKTRMDISISEMMYFIRMVGTHKDFDKVARVTGITGRTPKQVRERVEEMKNMLELALARMKRIMRGTSSDKTHAGVAHPIQVAERYNETRRRAIENRWKMRSVMRQLGRMDESSTNYMPEGGWIDPDGYIILVRDETGMYEDHIDVILDEILDWEEAQDFKRHEKEEGRLNVGGLYKTARERGWADFTVSGDHIWIRDDKTKKNMTPKQIMAIAKFARHHRLEFNQV